MAANLQPVASVLERREYLLVARRIAPTGSEEYTTSCIRGLDRALANAREANRVGWTVSIEGCGFDYARTFHAA